MIQALLDIFQSQSICDVFVVCEKESEFKWSKSEGGAIGIEFDNDTVVFTQPLGREIVHGVRTTVEEFLHGMKQEQPETDFACFSLFDLFCYRCDLNDPGPTVQEIVGFHKDDNLNGLVLKLSTGGSIGLDASSYGGLTYFLDGQLESFRREYAGPCELEERIIWALT